ncbi:hypothetical protein SMMN14_00318 [Sphaerulina musiva]
MRLLALLPIALCITSLVLAFLCLFAGSRRGFMEDYAILTLNTSRLGQNIFNTTESSSNPLVNFLDNISNTIESEIQDGITDVAQQLGIHDFYSAHLMTYCEGYYYYNNSTRDNNNNNNDNNEDDAQKNITKCSNRTALYNFNPQKILQQELDASNTGIDLSDLNWPSDISTGLNALRIAAKATFVLYCIAIGFIGIALLAAIASIFLAGRLSAILNVIADWMAFVTLGIASAIATAVAVKGARTINKYGGEVGVSADRGNKFLVITWVATGLLLLSSVVWCVLAVMGRRRYKAGTVPKYG